MQSWRKRRCCVLWYQSMMLVERAAEKPSMLKLISVAVQRPRPAMTGNRDRFTHSPAENKQHAQLKESLCLYKLIQSPELPQLNCSEHIHALILQYMTRRLNLATITRVFPDHVFPVDNSREQTKNTEAFYFPLTRERHTEARTTTGTLPVYSPRISLDMMTVKMGAELFTVSANDTATFLRLTKPRTTVVNLQVQIMVSV